MQTLNSRLAIYVDTITQLKERNQKLKDAIDDLRSNCTTGEQYSVSFEKRWKRETVQFQSTTYSAMSEATKIDRMARENAEITVKIARLKENLNFYRLGWFKSFVLLT